jgi:hypothetical protein
MIKPIHKFNNGNGATLCNNCSKVINNGFTDALYCNEICESKHNLKLNFTDKEYRQQIDEQFKQIKERANNLMRLKNGFKDKQ